MTTWILTLVLCAIAAPRPAAAPAATLAATLDRADGQPATVLTLADDGRGTPYVVSKADNICGLDEPRQITSPAKVDYDALLEDTAEVRELRRNGIDPNSSKGITLMTKARSRVLKACETVRTESGYDSVWKAISRRDGKGVTDVTDSVRAKLASSGD